MARKSIDELKAQATTDFPDNTAQLITPAKLRNLVLDFLNTVSPFYGVLQIGPTPVVKQANIAESIITPWDSVLQSDASQVVCSAATGTVTRTERGVSRITFQATAAAPNNAVVTFGINRNGAPTGFVVTVIGLAGADPQGVNLVAIVESTVGGDVFTATIKATANGVNVNLSNTVLIVENIPVRSFT